MAIPASKSPNEPLELSCPLEKNSPARRFARIAAKAGFWFFLIKGLVWLGLAGAAIIWGGDAIR